jgi:hypothetical protein
MKKHLFNYFFIIAVISMTISVAISANLITITNTVIRKDPGGIPLSCPDTGQGCIVTVKTPVAQSFTITYNSQSGQYTLNSNVGSLEATVLREGPYTFDQLDRYLVFPTGSEIEITACSVYPELVGHHVSLEGISTNSAGDYTVQFTL